MLACRLEGRIKFYFKQINYDGVDWIYVVQNKSPLARSSGHTSRSEVRGSMKGE